MPLMHAISLTVSDILDDTIEDRIVLLPDINLRNAFNKKPFFYT